MAQQLEVERVPAAQLARHFGRVPWELDALSRTRLKE
jgi:hypothetical protein